MCACFSVDTIGKMWPHVASLVSIVFVLSTALLSSHSSGTWE